MGGAVDARVFTMGFLRAAARLAPDKRALLADGLRAKAQSVRGVGAFVDERPQSDPWLDIANALEAMNDWNPFYEGARNVPESTKAPVNAAINKAKQASAAVSLEVANQLDRAYQAAAEQAAKVAQGLREGVKDAGWSLMPLALAALVLAFSWGKIVR